MTAEVQKPPPNGRVNGANRQPMTDEDLLPGVEDVITADHRRRLVAIHEHIPAPINEGRLSPDLVKFLDGNPLTRCEVRRPGGGPCTTETPSNSCILRRRYDALNEESERKRRIEKLIARGPEARGYRFEPIDSATFAATDCRPKWLVENMLVRSQPAVIGGPSKTLKTSTLIDLAFSLASGHPFLGCFPIAERLRVAIISGESGQATLQETARRVCAAKGISFAQSNVIWDFRLPQLADAFDVGALADGLRENAADVVAIDPLYLCLLRGPAAAGKKSGIVFDMGPILSDVAAACLSVGCTPVLLHHARKGQEAHDEPLELKDLTGSGVEEFARQWLLWSRREQYRPGTGSHRLLLNAGGSIGHSGIWSVDVEESVLLDNFTGRIWDVTVRSADEAASTRAKAKEDAKAAERTHKDKADDLAVLNVLRKHDPDRNGMSRSKVRELSGWGSARVTRAVARLADDGLLEELSVEVPSGANKTRSIPGHRILHGKSHPDTRTDPDARERPDHSRPGHTLPL